MSPYAYAARSLSGRCIGCDAHFVEPEDTMTPLAVVILAHADPVHLKRLVDALPDVPVVLHCDARTPSPIFREMTAGLAGRVRIIERQKTTLSSWSLVSAELAALREAIRWTGARHVAVLSGADYPLVPMDQLLGELARMAGRSWIANRPLPFPEWDTARNPDGGLWRLRHRFLTRGDQVVHLGEMPLRWPWRRAVPADLELRACSAWKIYGRSDAEALLRLVDQRPELVRFWRTTLVPEESFVASMLASRKLIGADALAPCDFGPWYLDWDSDRPGHPRWLSEVDFDRLAAARRRATVRLAGGGPAGPPEEDGGNLFARKFRSSDSAVLDRIDGDLLN
jgi:hypothetical protein